MTTAFHFQLTYWEYPHILISPCCSLTSNVAFIFYFFIYWLLLYTMQQYSDKKKLHLPHELCILFCKITPPKKDINSKWCALNGDLKVTWCGSRFLPKGVGFMGKEHWYPLTGNPSDALWQENSLPRCCSSKKKKGKKNLLHMNFAAKCQRVLKKFTDYLRYKKIKNERWFKLSSESNAL